jgi:hypothetical protein
MYLQIWVGEGWKLLFSCMRGMNNILETTGPNVMFDLCPEYIFCYQKNSAVLSLTKYCKIFWVAKAEFLKEKGDIMQEIWK